MALEIVLWLATIILAANGLYRTAMAVGATAVALALLELAWELRADRLRRHSKKWCLTRSRRNRSTLAFTASSVTKGADVGVAHENAATVPKPARAGISNLHHDVAERDRSAAPAAHVGLDGENAEEELPERDHLRDLRRWSSASDAVTQSRVSSQLSSTRAVSTESSRPSESFRGVAAELPNPMVRNSEPQAENSAVFVLDSLAKGRLV
jgi:hypothetical protein